MASSDPAPATWLERMDDIPDPAALAAAAPVPAPALPAAPSLTRAQRRGRARGAVVFALAWVVALVVFLGFRADLGSPGVASPIALGVLGGAGVLALVLHRGARGLPGGVRIVQHAVWIVPAAYVLGMVLVARGDGPVTWASVRGCLCLSTLIAVGPLTAAALVLRGSFLSAAGWRGAAVGALAGLAGSIGIHAHCPVQDLGHLLAAHGTAILVYAAAGGALGRLGGRA